MYSTPAASICLRTSWIALSRPSWPMNASMSVVTDASPLVKAARARPPADGILAIARSGRQPTHGTSTRAARPGPVILPRTTGPNDGGSREERTRDRAGGGAPAHHGDRRVGRDPRRRARALRSVPREGRPLDPRPAGRPARRQADHHDRDHADEGRRGQDHHVALAHAGHGEDRQGRRALPARALDGTGVRHQGRRHRRRLRAGRADGGHQPPLQRRLPRGHGGPQPAGVGARRLALLRQPAGDRPHQHHVAADARRERARAPVHGHRPRRQDARRPARERVRDHRRVRGDGGARARVRSRRPPRPPGADRRRVDGGRASRSPPSSSRSPAR